MVSKVTRKNDLHLKLHPYERSRRGQLLFLGFYINKLLALNKSFMSSISRQDYLTCKKNNRLKEEVLKGYEQKERYIQVKR